MRGGTGERRGGIPQEPVSALLPRNRCQVVGLNENYTSRAGTGYHIQVEDRGPVFDDASETWVRRVNTIVYAHYGEPSARIIWGRDEDFPDIRTPDQNHLIEGKIKEAASAARRLVEVREERQATRIKSLLLHYHQSRGEEAKAEFEEANRLYPFVFARAWQELKQERPPVARVPKAAVAPPVPEIDETIYPLDPLQRDLVLEIERIREELEKDLAELKRSGAADDILLATCAKILYRAHESLTQRSERGSDFAARRLEMTKNSLVTTYRQVRARLTRQREGSAP
jgi:hypothetical protein